jgi:hypothetical protein
VFDRALLPDRLGPYTTLPPKPLSAADQAKLDEQIAARAAYEKSVGRELEAIFAAAKVTERQSEAWVPMYLGVGPTETGRMLGGISHTAASKLARSAEVNLERYRVGDENGVDLADHVFTKAARWRADHGPWGDGSTVYRRNMTASLSLGRLVGYSLDKLGAIDHAHERALYGGRSRPEGHGPDGDGDELLARETSTAYLNRQWRR